MEWKALAARLSTAGAPHWGVLTRLVASDVYHPRGSVAALNLSGIARVPGKRSIQSNIGLRPTRLTGHRHLDLLLHSPVHSGGDDYFEVRLSDATMKRHHT